MLGDFMSGARAAAAYCDCAVGLHEERKVKINLDTYMEMTFQRKGTS